MGLFRGAEPVKDTDNQYNRTNTKLQVGTHDAPGESYLIDPRLKRLFTYHFGGDGWVVIPQGRVVAPSRDDGGEFSNGTIYNYEGDVYSPVLTLANGGVDVTEEGKTEEHTRAANIPIGVAYANLYEEILDGFKRMQPTVENEIYIELPYIPNKEDAEEMHWGSFYDADPLNPVAAGDFVMSDENGRVIKADFRKVMQDIQDAKEKATSSTDVEGMSEALVELAEAQTELVRLKEQVIGQVWAVETNLPPQGWLKWVGWSDDQRREDDNPSGMSAKDTNLEFPGYPYERTYANWDVKSNRYYPQGIPGLTNGSKIEVPFEDVVLGHINPGQSGRYDFRAEQVPLVVGSLEVKVDGEVVTPVNVHHESGLITLNVEENTGDTPQVVTANFKATGQLPGIPTGWDWKGSVGAVRILLQK